MEIRTLVLFIILIASIFPLIYFSTISGEQQSQVASSGDFVRLCLRWRQITDSSGNTCVDSTRLIVDNEFKDKNKNLTELCQILFSSDWELHCRDACRNGCSTDLKPDLAVGMGVGELEYDPPSKELNITFKNIGSYSVRNVKYSIEVSDGTIKTGNIALLESLKSKVIRITSIDLLGKTTKIKIDPDNQIEEESEKNNCVYIKCNKVGPPGLLCDDVGLCE